MGLQDKGLYSYVYSYKLPIVHNKHSREQQASAHSGSLILYIRAHRTLLRYLAKLAILFIEVLSQTCHLVCWGTQPDLPTCLLRYLYSQTYHLVCWGTQPDCRARIAEVASVTVWSFYFASRQLSRALAARFGAERWWTYTSITRFGAERWWTYTSTARFNAQRWWTYTSITRFGTGRWWTYTIIISSLTNQKLMKQIDYRIHQTDDDCQRQTMIDKDRRWLTRTDDDWQEQTMIDKDRQLELPVVDLQDGQLGLYRQLFLLVFTRIRMLNRTKYGCWTEQNTDGDQNEIRMLNRTKHGCWSEQNTDAEQN